MKAITILLGLSSLSLAQNQEFFQYHPTPTGLWVINPSPNKQNLQGFIIQAPNRSVQNTGWTANIKSNPYSDTVLFTGSSQYLMDPLPHDSVFFEGLILQEPFEIQSLFKTGSCEALNTNSNPNILDTNNLSSILNNTYYDNNPSQLGSSRSQFNHARILDSFQGSQYLLKLPSANFTINGTSAHFNPKLLKSPLSLMSLVMIREYLQISDLLLLSNWAKETGFLLEYGSQVDWYDQINTNSDGAFGPGEVETTTFLSRAFSYPQWFAQDTCLTQYSSSNKNSCSLDHSTFAKKYLGAMAKVSKDSAWIVNNALASALVWKSNFDIAQYSTDLQFKAHLTKSLDSNFAICVLAPTYNLGINSGTLDILKSKVNNTLSCADLPNANGNYKNDLLNVYNLLNTEQSKSTTFIDQWITLADIQRFYFGENSNTSHPWTTPSESQEGGLLKHFNLSTQEKQDLWQTVLAGFNTQSKHWATQNSQTVISLRYDWITQLRLATKFLKIQHNYPQGEELRQWISEHSINPTDKTDFTPPSMVEVPPVVGMGGTHTAMYQFTDEQSGTQSFEFSLDSLKSPWQVAHLTIDSYWSGISPEPTLPFKFLARASDSCGNTTIQWLDYLDRPSSVKALFPSKTLQPLWDASGRHRINQAQIRYFSKESK